jgi:adenine-specific DNA methylase
VSGTPHWQSENPPGPLLPKTEKIAEEIEMWKKSPKSLIEMNESRDEKDRVGMQIANPDLVVQAKALEEYRNPKSSLERIFKNNNLTGSGIREAF